MYNYLQRWGERVAFWGTTLWYVLLLIILILSFSAPPGEFRYGMV
jgi:hypothetical protein